MNVPNNIVPFPSRDTQTETKDGDSTIHIRIVLDFGDDDEPRKEAETPRGSGGAVWWFLVGWWLGG